jgi:L-ascorbate metabolism protein UlaG (beta-lactamase superfamily)
MKKPYLRDDAFLADAASVRGDTARLHVWWLGQSGFLVQWRDTYVLFDPYLSDSLTTKYAATDKPHVRMTERVIAPERLNFVDVVTSSHNHTDHLDAETLKPIFTANLNTKFVIPEANRDFVAERLGCDRDWPTGIDDGETKTIAGVEFTAVPAAHNTIERDAQGRCHFLGYIAKLGPFTIYHSGDTLRYDGMAERLCPFNADVALLPINGNRPERRVAGNLNGAEAAQLAHDIGASIVIPCHYDMFAFNTANPADVAAACEMLGQACVILQNGQRWSSDDA